MLSSLSIEHFRAFKSLEIAPIHRVNLIAGANNIGKTSLLEALWLANASPADDLKSFPKLFRQTQQDGTTQDIDDNFWAWLFYEKDFSQKWKISKKDDDTNSVIKLSFFNTDRTVNGSLQNYPKHQTIVFQSLDSNQNLNNSYSEQRISNFVSVRFPNNTLNLQQVFAINTRATPPAEEAELVNAISVRNEDDTLIEYLREIEPRLQKLKYLRLPNHRHPYVYADVGFGKGRELIPATQLGQGFARMLHLFATLLITNPKILLIDEFENGLQHDALVPIWKALGKFVRDRDIQIFATTHSIENIQAAHSAFSENNANDLGLIKLLRQSNGSIKAGVFDYEMLEASIASNLEIR